jgi:hypothetical protein
MWIAEGTISLGYQVQKTREKVEHSGILSNKESIMVLRQHLALNLGALYYMIEAMEDME